MHFRIKLILITIIFFCCNMSDKRKVAFDWQGHRGARGLVPENTIPSFLKAIDYGVQTLELDVAVSKDNQIIVSHEPWFSSAICTKPDGTPVTEEEEQKLLIFNLNYEEIKQYDCGKRGNSRFPEQLKMPVYKPSLVDMVETIERHIEDKELLPIRYNIEIKSRPTWDNIKTPEPKIFATLLMDTLKALGIHKRTCIQSFDIRTIQEVRKIDEKQTIALLIENQESIKKNIELLGFVPQIYSPYYLLLSKENVSEIHDMGMKVIPWTVNDTTMMKKLIDMNVDGIITDYPNLIKPEWKKN